MRAVHLLGVGGAGMSALARLAAQAGYLVSGSDREESAVLTALRQVGVDARVGHTSELPDRVDAVVVSTAIRDDNPALVAARARGVEVLHRADFLAELMRGHRGLAVAGAHGKSTTSAMLTLALGGASACVGATMPGGGGTGALWGDGPWFVAEADESDRSLLRLSPEAAIVTNVEHEHHATYATLDDVRDVYRAFVSRLPKSGLLVLGPDEEARRLAADAPCEVRLIGPVEGEWGRVGPTGAGLAVHDGRTVPLSLGVPGRHNLENAACALAMAHWCGVPLDEASARLATFTGVGRRFEERGTAGGIRVVDDYAHHPTEVIATLAAAREGHTGRIVAVFQPHLYSRTRALSAELGASLAGADVVVVTEIYGSREDVDPGVSGRLVADAVPPPVETFFAPTLASAADRVMEAVRPGDLLLTMGAGDVTELGQELLARLAINLGDGVHHDRSAPA
jgi:UDP-N-acetylmuramate--alanine ligase